MRKAPYYQHYPEDFMTGCSRSRMTPEQVGMYIMLLDALWIDQGPVEADYRRLAIMTGFDIRHVKRLIAELIAKGKISMDGNYLRNGRMMDEITKFTNKLKAERAAKEAADAAAGEVADGAATGVSNQTANQIASGTFSQGAKQAATDTAKQDLFLKGSEINEGNKKQHRDTRASSESRTQNLESRTSNPPTPQGGKAGEPSAGSGKAKTRSELAAERRQLANAGIDLWNATARELGFGTIDMRSDQRINRMALRLDDIGGVEQLKLALATIHTDDWLMGRVTPRNGGTPFRLTYERFLSTGSEMGDVIARLLDRAKQGAPQPAQAASTKVVPPKENWWVGKDPDVLREASEGGWIDLINTWAKGFWPVKFLGPPPGSDGCIVNPQVIVSENLIERFGAPEKHVQ